MRRDSENIIKIMSSDLWKRILRNKYYRGHYTFNTGVIGFPCLLIFFHHEISEKIIEKYRSEGARMSKGEGLDNYETKEFYGVKMLIYS